MSKIQQGPGYTWVTGATVISVKRAANVVVIDTFGGRGARVNEGGEEIEIEGAAGNHILRCDHEATAMNIEEIVRDWITYDPPISIEFNLAGETVLTNALSGVSVAAGPSYTD